MHPIDYAIIVLYFVAVIGTGFWYQRRASQNIESYFLGGKRIHWLALAMSGSVSNFDITGTMWIVTLITLFGMKSMWNHWMWGFLMGAFFLAFMGKWIRRSNVMTGAEWMVTRFGDGRDGFTARIAYTLMAVVTVAAFIGYAFQGIGKFTSVYIDVDPRICATAIFAITTLYVLLGGLYSVVITDVIQTIVLTIGSIVIAVVAYVTVSPETIAGSVSSDWTSIVPVWRLGSAELSNVMKFDEAAGTSYAAYELFGALVLVWVAKGLVLNMGGPAQMYDFQRFLAAKNPRDAAKVGAAWSGFLVVRWAMAMGIALLAVTGALQVSDPEKFMPAVLEKYLWVGIRGMVIAGLLAAFMSTFSSTVNSGASYLVRDLWQPLLRRGASDRHLVRAGYVATLLIVLVGTLIGLTVSSIGAIFSWIMMELGAAFAIPNLLRWYWWRMNAWGYAVGTLVGLAGAIVVPFLPNAPPLYVTFPAICGLSLVATLLGALLTKPTDQTILVKFYESVRPFGAWGHIRQRANPPEAKSDGASESLWLAAVNVVLGGIAILSMYLFPMYLVGHWHGYAAVCFALAAAAVVTLYFTWYRMLPEAD